MNFKIDENLPLEFIDLLRGAGHDAVTVLDQQLGGADDSTVATRCRQEHRVLITLDLDFCDIREYPPEDHHGLIVLRVHRQDKLTLIRVFRQAIGLLASEPLSGRLWIVEESKIRIRGGD
jgi:predicted nuclease of predicted toxin-antitoxin system